MIAEEAYVLSKSFTKKSLDGQGALKGAPCTIKSITEVDGGQKVTFEWTGTSGTKQTSEMTVKNGVSVTGISDKGNGKFTLLLSDGSESDPIQCVKGEDGFSPTATVEKVGKVATITITDKNGTTTATIKDGEGSEGGEANVIDSISVNGVNVPVDENKNVDIIVPSIEGLTKDADLATVAKSGNYEDLSNKPAIPSVEGLAKTTDIPTKVSQLENDSNYLSSIPEEYVTETELSAKGYLTEHQDLSNYATKDEIPIVPSKVSELTNDSNYQTADDVTAALAPYAKSADVSTEIITEIAKVVADAPEDLNTLKEMSDWIAGHENDASAMNSAIQKNKTDISTLQTDKADASDLTAHTDDADIHVTADDKTLWNTVDDKVDKTSIATTLSSDLTNDEVIGAKLAYDELKKVSSETKEQFATASGESISVNDSVDGKICDLKVYGKSFQQSYTGKNLLNPTLTTTTTNGITCTQNVGLDGKPDGTYTLNGTATAFTQFSLAKKLISDNIKICGCPSGGSTDSFYIVAPLYKNDTWTLDIKDVGKGVTVKDIDYDYYNINIAIASGATVNNVVFKPMLVDASLYPEVTYDDFEPYVGGIPSPNPSYPQTINSVGDDGSLVVTSCGKNLAKNANLSTSLTSREVTFVTKSDGTIVVNGTPTQATDNWVWCTGNSNFLLRKGKYLWTGCPTNDGSNKYRLLLRNVEKPWKENNDYGNGVTFELTEDKAFCFFVGISYGYVANNLTFKPMLRRCDDNWIPYGDDLYEPYKETTTTIPLSEPLRSIGDIKDEITYQDGKWGVIRRIKKLVADTPKLINPDGALTGTTYDILVNFEFDAQDSYNAVNKISDMSKHIFRNFQSINIWDKDECGVYISWAGSISARLSSSICGSTLDEVKAYFKNNPLIGQYVLATPVFEPFADQSLPYLSTYDGATNISNDDALSAEMTVKYPTTDASGVGSKNESRIAELAKDTDDKFDDVNDSLSVIGKCKNLLNPTLQTTTQNGVTCTNNGDGTYTLDTNGGTSTKETYFVVTDSNNGGRLSIQKYKLVGCRNGSTSTFNIEFYNVDKWGLDIGDGLIIDPKVERGYRIRICIQAGVTLDNVVFKPMITTNLNATYDDFVPYTGDGETLTHDVAELKKDLSTKIYELAGSELYLCVSGKSCVLTLNGYNLTGSTNFSKLAEYPPYLVARNVVSKEDGVCIFSVDPNGNIGASDLQVASSVTGKMFGEVSWVANI